MDIVFSTPKISFHPTDPLRWLESLLKGLRKYDDFDDSHMCEHHESSTHNNLLVTYHGSSAQSDSVCNGYRAPLDTCNDMVEHH